MIQLTKKDLYQIQIAMKLDEYMYEKDTQTYFEMDLWGISKTELFKIAYDNLQQLLPLQIIPFTQIVNNKETICLNVKYTVAALPKDSFYVVTNIFHNNCRLSG